MSNSNGQRIIRQDELAERLGVTRVTLWRWCRQGLLPKPLQLGPNTTGWTVQEIDAWIQARAAERDQASEVA
jgi:prophage regulatory protein